MNRRDFLKAAGAATTASTLAVTTSGVAEEPLHAKGKARAEIAAYYFRAHMYTCVPRHIREDMEWMADKGTHYVCPAVLEQDLFAARENLEIVTAEAERVGMRVLAVPSRWGGLTAGAPKVPSLFSSLNPGTWMQLEDGSTGVNARVSGVVSSVHHPDTLAFFCETLAEMYRQHPSWAGMIIDEPKPYRADYSRMAKEALGEDAPMAAHFRAASRFFTDVCAYAKESWPDKKTILFVQAHKKPEELQIASEVGSLDYFGADGRPWGREDDARMEATDEGHQEGKGKILLSGVGEQFIQLAKAEEGRRSFFLIENHNLQASMIDALDRNYPAVLSLPADMFCYYYYPRNVQEPERVMEIIGGHIKRYAKG